MRSDTESAEATSMPNDKQKENEDSKRESPEDKKDQKTEEQKVEKKGEEEPMSGMKRPATST